MSQYRVNQLLQTALKHHHAGELPQAEQVYRKMLALQPNDPNALHLLGVLANQTGHHDAAIDLIRRALAVQPYFAEAIYHLGTALKAAGRLDEAITSYRDAITLQTEQPAWHFHLGLALAEKKSFNEAIASFKKVIKLDPKSAEAQYQLGTALLNSGEMDQAIAAFQEAVALYPAYADAWNDLGAALHREKKLEEAIAAYRRAVEIHPAYAAAHNNLGAALREDGEFDEAIAACQQAIALKPDYFEAHVNLGSALKAAGQLDEAVARYHLAISLRPASAEAYSNLGIALVAQRKLPPAIAALRQAISINPHLSEAYASLGNCLRDNGDLDESIRISKALIAFDPENEIAWNNLANTLKDTGQLDESIAAYRQAIAMDTHGEGFYGNLLFALNYQPGADPQAIADEHLKWGRMHEASAKAIRHPHTNDVDPNRRLRIGYVSPDFRQHVVCRFLLPLFSSHDHDQFEIICYAEVEKPDAMSKLVRDRVDGWRTTVDLTSEKIAAMIRADQIDILVDLAGHTPGNRLDAFVFKPAPIQVTYLGYPATTGMSSIDYRLTDVWADPPGKTESFHSEQLLRLNRCAWAFEPPRDANPVFDPPAIKNKYITFGSFSNLTKLNVPQLRMWAQILNRVPGSKLILKSPAVTSKAAQQWFEPVLRDQGIGPDRIDLRGWAPVNEHLQIFNEVDIALDAFPYHGTTTTCETIWMGIPLVTLAGQSHVSRVGVSLLNAVGLDDLVAASPEQYVQIAVDLAGNLPRLSELRKTLRGRMENSPLTDGAGLARAMEAEYRRVWKDWCAIRRHDDHDPVPSPSTLGEG